MRKLLAIALLFVSTSALAAQGPRNSFAHYGRVINAATLDASSTSFAVNLDNPSNNGIFGLMVVWTCLTDASNSVTALNMSCTASRDGGTTDYTLQSCATSAGVCTSSNASWTKDPSAMTSKCWPWRVDIEGLPEIECTITDTGGDASDSITSYVSFAVKG